MNKIKLGVVSAAVATCLSGAITPTFASATPIAMNEGDPTMQAKKDETYVFIIDLQKATLTPLTKGQYTLTFSDKSIKNITAMSRPPYSDIRQLTPSQYSKIAHSGGKDSFDNNPPNLLLSMNNHSLGAYVLTGYKKAKGTVTYTLKPIPYYQPPAGEAQAPISKNVPPPGIVKGHASLFVDDAGWSF